MSNYKDYTQIYKDLLVIGLCAFSSSTISEACQKQKWELLFWDV